MARSLLARVRQQAGLRCGYCQSSSAITGEILTIEHIVPVARHGSSDEENLWLSCRRCNQYKGTLVEAIDPETETLVPLFNPRKQVWSEHFAWSSDGTLILGLTPIGRATVVSLRMNHRDIVSARQLWVNVGWHPPNA